MYGWWYRVLLAGLSVAAMHAHAQGLSRPDALGGADHTLLQRYEGSWLVAWKRAGYTESRPLSMLSDSVAAQRGLNNKLSVEGESIELYYVSPSGRTSQEVQRSYEEQLKKAGAVQVYACTEDAWGCYTRGGPAYQQLADGSVPRDQQVQVPWGTSLAFGPMSRNLRLAVYRMPQRGGDVWATIYTVDTPPDVREFANRSASHIQIVQPIPPEPEKRPDLLDAVQLARSLATDGRVVLPGLWFTGGRQPKFKRESGKQLAEVAKLLVAKPDLQLYVVAHTDSQADKAEHKRARQQAELVITALTKRYGIERSRVKAGMAGALAPLARNATDTGRERNRRIELVER